MRTAVTILALAGLVAAAPAQDFRRPGPPVERPQGTPESVAPARDVTAVPVTPAEPADAEELLDRSLIGADAEIVPVGVVMPEGTLVTRRTGLLLRAPTGESVFVFDPAPASTGKPGQVVQPTLRPMVLLPTQSRARMEELSSADGQRRFSISGELTVYRGRNFLLPTAFSRVAEQESAAGDEELADGDLTRLAEDPSVDELIRALEDRRDMPRGLMNPKTEAPDKAARRDDPRNRLRPDAEDDRLVSAAAISEGKLLMQRPARLVRIQGGVLALATDQGIGSGTGSGTGEEADDTGPIVVMPGQLAERLEAIAGRHGDALSVEVSGRLYGYAGVTYVLPTLVSIEPPSDVTPLH